MILEFLTTIPVNRRLLLSPKVSIIVLGETQLHFLYLLLPILRTICGKVTLCISYPSHMLTIYIAREHGNMQEIVCLPDYSSPMLEHGVVMTPVSFIDHAVHSHLDVLSVFSRVFFLALFNLLLFTVKPSVLHVSMRTRACSQDSQR